MNSKSDFVGVPRLRNRMILHPAQNAAEATSSDDRKYPQSATIVPINGIRSCMTPDRISGPRYAAYPDGVVFILLPNAADDRRGNCKAKRRSFLRPCPSVLFGIL